MYLMTQMMPNMWIVMMVLTIMWMKKMMLSNYNLNNKKTKIKMKKKMMKW